jgi:hypothetical protein
VFVLKLILSPSVRICLGLIKNLINQLRYNTILHKGLVLLLYFVGMYFSLPLWQLGGVILFSNAFLDRIFGSGSKYEKGFGYTH